MSEIKTFPFNKDDFNQIKDYKFGRNWPVVYVLEDKKEIYIGQTVNAHARSKQHYENPERSKLKSIHIITDEEFNVSAALDIESWLIQYISADGLFTLQNGNGGLKNHNYYDRIKYKTKFEIAWDNLRQMGIAKNTLEDLKNSDLFKYSPYKSLTEDQLLISRQIEKDINKNSASTFIINGKPGTGKTILATYLFKYLKEQEQTKDFSMALVIPMTQLRTSIKKVFTKIKELSASMVIGPSEVVNKNYDLIIVDEAHRLHRPVNISNLGSHYKNNLNSGLTEKGGTELDWIIKFSKKQIFFYDEGQSVGPSCVKHEDFLKLQAKTYSLTEQKRIEAGDEYIEFIEDIFNFTTPKKVKFQNYDFKIYNDMEIMAQDIKEKDKDHGLSRMIAGYAWPWHTKKGKGGYDIEINGFKGVWNSVVKDWVYSKNAVNEVGCIHTIQGYGLNYAGVIVGPEFGYNPNSKKFFVDKKKYFDRNGHAGITDPNELERYIINIYKTLLTRGIKGTYVYIVDENLRNYFNQIINKKSISIKNEISKIAPTKIPSPYVGEMISLPLFDSAGCGELMFADSTVQEMIDVPAAYVSKGSKYFVLRTTGDSMNKAGINDGDLVLCRKNYHPEIGNKVVALIGDDATIKEYHRDNGAVVLKPCSTNPKHQPMKFTENEEMSVQAVVVRVLKDL